MFGFSLCWHCICITSRKHSLLFFHSYAFPNMFSLLSLSKISIFNKRLHLTSQFIPSYLILQLIHNAEFVIPIISKKPTDFRFRIMTSLQDQKPCLKGISRQIRMISYCTKQLSLFSLLLKIFPSVHLSLSIFLLWPWALID